MELIFYPDQPVSLIISARQEIFSVRGGVLATRPRDAREPSSDPCESNLQKRFTSFRSGKIAHARLIPSDSRRLPGFLVGDLERHQSWLRFRERCLMAQIGGGVPQPFLLAQFLEELYPLANWIQRFHLQVS